jgi:hypothetical protein
MYFAMVELAAIAGDGDTAGGAPYLTHGEDS